MKRLITNPHYIDGTDHSSLVALSAGTAFTTTPKVVDDTALGSGADEISKSFVASATTITSGQAKFLGFQANHIDEPNMSWHFKGNFVTQADLTLAVFPVVSQVEAASAAQDNWLALNYTASHGNDASGVEIVSIEWDDHFYRELAGIGDDDQALQFGIGIINLGSGTANLRWSMGTISVFPGENPPPQSMFGI